MAVYQHDGGGGRSSSAGWWPGLEGGAGKNEMDPGAVRELARQLEELWNELTDNTVGTPEDLYAKSEVVAANDAFGRWETGAEMTDNYLAAHKEMAKCYDELRQQLAKAIWTLRHEANEFEGVDAEVAGSFPVDQAGYGLGVGGPGVPGTPETPATPGMPG